MPNSRETIISMAQAVVQDALDGNAYRGFDASTRDANKITLWERMGQHGAAVLLQGLLREFANCNDEDEMLHVVSLRVARDAWSQGQFAACSDVQTTAVQQAYLNGFTQMVDSIVSMFD